jgi:hypothetical protein
MRQRPSIRILKWKWWGLISIAMVGLSLIPQIHLWIVRRQQWNGSFVSAFIDEAYYAGYVNALIDGRPRRNDPFGGKDDSPTHPLPESLYSIQFLPAYAIALPARLFSVSASTAFIVLTPIAALLASISVFWLLISVTNDRRLAAAGTLFVLCLGGFFGSYGLFARSVDIAIPVLPFLRRYEPAVAFPLYLLFAALVWRALTDESKNRSRLFALLAGFSLALLVFSYLYLWTAATAWLACISVLWFLLRRFDRSRTLWTTAIIGAIAVLTLIPYLHLVSHRALATDEQQIMVATHRPEVFHVHEIIAAIVLLTLVLRLWRGRIAKTDPRFIFTASLGLLPFVVFNQQIVTGRTLQAFHFEIYSVNYSVAVGVMLTLALFLSPVSRRVLVWIAALSFTWGFFAVALPARAIGVALATENDRRVPVLLRLKQLAKEDHTLADLQSKGEASTLVFSPTVPLIALLPLWTSQGALLDITGGDCAGVSREQRKNFFYMHLYYSNVRADMLRAALNGPLEPMPDELWSVRTVVFGHARIFPGLSSSFVPVRSEEIEQEVQLYQAYINSFSRDEVLKRPIKYAIIPVDGDFDFSNLDRWYERDAGERIGDYVLYTLKAKD